METTSPAHHSEPFRILNPESGEAASGFKSRLPEGWRLLNLYAGIGGNRALWRGDVTAVENDPAIAAVYAERFASDVIHVGDANEFLIDRGNSYDFIWASPPCPSHGQYRYNVGVRAKGYRPLVPDMTSLYGTIVYLQHHFAGLWAVENVIPYYQPLIPPTARLGRHLVWANFPIYDRDFAAKGIRSKNKISDYDDLGVDLRGTKIANKRQVLRNTVDAKVGQYVLESARAYS